MLLFISFFFYCIVDVWKSFIRHLHIPFIVLTLFQRYLSLLAEIELLPIYWWHYSNMLYADKNIKGWKSRLEINPKRQEVCNFSSVTT